jgi:C-terminal processing protease CtpA/Prc
MIRLGLLALLVELTITPARAQDLNGEARQRGHRMLQQLREQLEKRYYDSTYHGIDLGRSYAQADSAIERAGSLPKMMAVLAQFLGNLNDSHTRFDPPGLNVTVRYGWSPQAFGDDCFVVAVTPKSDAEKKGLHVGDHVLAIDGIRPSRDNLYLINYVYYRLSPRPGMRLVVESPTKERKEILVRAEMKRRSAVVDVTDIDQRRMLLEQWRRSSSHANHHRRTFGDSVMVWRMHGFRFGEGRNGFDEDIDRIMGEARKYGYLILDLRGNPGGAVVTEQRLLGHFLDEEIPLGTLHMRDTVIQLDVPPAGDGPYRGQVIVLIDSRSASASEITARTLQLRGRATIVGDRSAGAVMTSVYVPLELGSAFESRVLQFGMSVTISDVIMADGHSLEGHGVIPNIALVPTGSDLAEKRDPALAFALELAGVKISAEDAANIFPEDVER